MPSFFVVTNVACSYRLLHNICTSVGPYRLAQQTQVLQEGQFTPTIISSHFANKCIPNRNRPRDIRLRFRFFSVSLKNRPKPTDFLVINRKTNRSTFYFRFTTLGMGYDTTGLLVDACTRQYLRSWRLDATNEMKAMADTRGRNIKHLTDHQKHTQE